MSADDPSDEAMDAEFMRDAGGGPYAAARHAPKLSNVSRAINPRALLSAEAEGQQRDEHQAMVQGYAEPPPGLVSRQQIAAGDPYNAAREFRPNTTLPRGMPAVRIPPPPQRREVAPPPAPRVNEDARAWDAYAAAALQGLAALLGSYDQSAVIGEATALADALLEERRRRFPA